MSISKLAHEATMRVLNRQGMRYGYERVKRAEDVDAHFRVFDVRTDQRVATCYLEENAKLVTAALNYAALNFKGSSKP